MNFPKLILLTLLVSSCVKAEASKCVDYEEEIITVSRVAEYDCGTRPFDYDLTVKGSYQGFLHVQCICKE